MEEPWRSQQVIWKYCISVPSFRQSFKRTTNRKKRVSACSQYGEGGPIKRPSTKGMHHPIYGLLVHVPRRLHHRCQEVKLVLRWHTYLFSYMCTEKIAGSVENVVGPHRTVHSGFGTSCDPRTPQIIHKCCCILVAIHPLAANHKARFPAWLISASAFLWDHCSVVGMLGMLFFNHWDH